MSRLGNHALLTEVLWRFRNVRLLTDAVSAPWEHACGATAREVFGEMKRLGYLREATTAERLTAAYSVAQLKEIATQVGIKATGTKRKLVDGILAARPNVSGPMGDFVVLTDVGATELHARKAQRALEERDIRQAVVDCVRQRRLQEGLRIARAHIDRYAVDHLMPANPLSFRTPDSERLADAEWIVASSHEMLVALPREVAERVRYAAVLSVFGLSHDADLAEQPEGRFSSASVVARSLELCSRYAREVREAQKEWGMSKVRIEFLSSAGVHGCPAGRAMSRKKWPSAPLPPYPSPDCSRRDGCTCVWSVDVKF